MQNSKNIIDARLNNNNYIRQYLLVKITDWLIRQKFASSKFAPYGIHNCDWICKKTSTYTQI